MDIILGSIPCFCLVFVQFRACIGVQVRLKQPVSSCTTLFWQRERFRYWGHCLQRRQQNIVALFTSNNMCDVATSTSMMHASCMASVCMIGTHSTLHSTALTAEPEPWAQLFSFSDFYNITIGAYDIYARPQGIECHVLVANRRT